MEITIFGDGVTGNSLYRWFKSHTNHTVHRHDPPKGLVSENINKSTHVFVCVPVHTTSEGNLDTSILEECLDLCNEEQVIFVRSTLLPTEYISITSRYRDLNIVTLPEFLTERRAYEDQEILPILCGDDIEQSGIHELFPGKKIVKMRSEEAAMSKYVHNVFGALKVTFFNEIKIICDRERYDYKKVIEGVLLSGLISKDHTSVPGPDGQTGFGGKCFPKDLKAFNKIYKSGLANQTEFLNDNVFRL